LTGRKVQLSRQNARLAAAPPACFAPPAASSRGLNGTSRSNCSPRAAKDACASEALEIATYTALERHAVNVGDEQTAKLARSIRADEERMLERIMREIPKLTDAVVHAEVQGEPSYNIGKTGAADVSREFADDVKRTARKAQTEVKRTARRARKVPGGAQVEG
jgi:Domain of unknown function (DUF892)